MKPWQSKFNGPSLELRGLLAQEQNVCLSSTEPSAISCARDNNNNNKQLWEGTSSVHKDELGNHEYLSSTLRTYIENPGIGLKWQLIG